MICKDFEAWLSAPPEERFQDAGAAMAHRKDCYACRRLYEVDQAMEAAMASALAPVRMPDGLEKQVDISIDHALFEEPPKTYRTLIGPVAAALIIVLAFSAYLAGRPYQYRSFHDLSVAAVSRHLDGNTYQTFSAAQMTDALVMLSRELNFKVILPDLEKEGFILMGGRLCKVGKCRTAYLFYKKGDRTCSLFIMDTHHLAFELADGSSFSNTIKGCRTDIWKGKGQVYALVF